MTSANLHPQARRVDEAGAGSPSDGLPALSPDGLVDAVIAAAPECLQQGVLLQGIDWGRVAPGRVAAMLGDLGRRSVRVPGWLARALIVGGHVLPADAAGRLSPELQALNSLNGYSGSEDERRRLAAAHRRLCLLTERDAEVLAATVARLRALDWAEEAAELALSCWEAAPRVLTSAGTAIAAHARELPSARLRLAGFSTTHTLAQDLVPAFAACGWQAQVAEAGFGEGMAELISPAGEADCLVLLIDMEGFAQRDWRRPPEDGLELVRERADLLAAALVAYPERSPCPLLVNTLPSPPAPTAGLLDRQHALGLRRAIDIVNARILEAAARSGQVHVCDSDLALAHVPLARQGDPKMWFYGRLAYSAAATRALASSFAQAWQTLKRGPLKVLALDFDNTLWGGVYGDDGLEALACGTDFPGNAFSAFQHECLRLKGQGMLLAGLSKNNPDAISVFERHPGMVLRAEDFSAVAVDWEPKPGNIRRLAGELGLGLDSFLFLDDSPHEREAMRQMCPAVTVPEMPADPAMRPLWIRGLTATWPLRLTEEDGRRADMYRAERAARSLREGAASLGDYLAALEQRLVVEPLRRETVPRAAQMHQRTNQFNLTSVRLGEAELGAMLDARSGSLALIGRVIDKFGDHGIVIAATARIDGDAAEIATFLMSCRVIGREIERAFLGALLAELEKRGVRHVTGAYVPTPKNGQVRDFYRAAGFRQAPESAERTVWNWTIGEGEPPRSAFVTVEWGS